MHNDGGTSGQYALPGPGQVDTYGFDNYPVLFDCNNPGTWVEVPQYYDTVHQVINTLPFARHRWGF